MANVKDVKRFDPPTIELGGKLRMIQFDLNAFAELENKFGSIQKAMEQLQQGRMNDVRLILWAGLIHEEVILDPVTGEPTGYNITPYQVGSWIKNPMMLQEVTEKLAIAINGDMPDPQNMVNATIATADSKVEDNEPKLINRHQIAAVVPTEEEKVEQAKN